jgi:hypothetical protein
LLKRLASRYRRLLAASIFPAIILFVNLFIVAKLFRVEYSAYLESNEGSFIAIARQISQHFGDLRWWPLWDCGLPFQNTYLPLLDLLTAAFSRVSGHSPALAYHQLCAAFFVIGPVCLYFMAWRMTRRSGASFLAALAYSLFSPGAWFLPAVRADLGNPLHLRRLQILAYYGEGPYTASLAFLPLAILFLYLAITERRLWHKIAAGFFIAATVLANAFGAVILAAAALSLLAVIDRGRWRRNLWLLLSVAVVSYAVISPLLPPSVIAAIRMNSPTVGGDYRFTLRSLGGLGVLAAGLLALWWSTRRLQAPVVRFFLLFALVLAGIVWLGLNRKIYILPQPHRYQVAMEMALALLAVFGGTHLLNRFPRLVSPVVTAFLLVCAFQFRHDLNYAHRLIRSVDITASRPYRVARWMDDHRHGSRVMVSGPYSFWFNDFTDTPQLHGGHDPMLPNVMMRVAIFTIYTGTNAGARDGEIGIAWLKALGAHAIYVPGPQSSGYFQPFANPRKFEGLLPVLWRDGDDTIYDVPARSLSLAHVIPAASAVRDTPSSGLDTAEIERYVQALNDPSLPEAAFLWRNRHSAAIHAQLEPGEAVSVQVTYTPGWRALVNGAPQRVGRDGLGLILLEPDCRGPCEITLVYDGGFEWRAACLASLFGLAFVAARSCRAVIARERSRRLR